MLIKNEEGVKQIITALSIMDIVAHTSNIVDIRGYSRKALYVNNGLNQSVSIQIQGCYTNSPTDTDWVNIGTAQAVSASTKSVIGVNEVPALNNYFPYLRVTATCSIAPTTQALDVYLMVG